ncbi:hypothetical protein KFL_006700060 [Klebsormidium nitens]|uniref:Protein kinase-like domain containing protein n=1 Tax=Klebsormidium nitens TaxID=105231 RepID=A0A1Y1IRA4_KLENI|nr:hypothetical protein KFL_006700060 [Klebsormidium nitens]|eukprot:GAQ90668.1 hypothetical protein KFL_006700060 [Klebsormidium nitens]
MAISIQVMTRAPGDTLHAIAVRQNGLTATQYVAVEKTFVSLWSLGFVHGDSHANNILYDVKNDKPTCIDVGMSLLLPFAIRDAVRSFDPARYSGPEIFARTIDHLTHGYIQNYNADGKMLATYLKWVLPGERTLVNRLRYEAWKSGMARVRRAWDVSCIKRPDYAFIFDTHAVVLEVDEDHHRYYNVSCEVDRMGKIKDLVRLPLHFVRFNPAERRYGLLKDILKRLFRDCRSAENTAGEPHRGGLMPPKKPPDVALHHECLAYVSKLFKEPRTREDVKLRALRNKETECTVVKTSLNSFCKEAARALPLESVLKEVNKAICEAYILANLHILRMCELGCEVPPLDQPFFYNCLSAVSMAGRQKSSVKDLYLRETVELYLASRLAGYRPPDCKHLSSGWYQNASLQMATCIKNSIATNFYKRFKRYLKHTYSLDGPSCYAKMRDMFADEYEGNDPLVLRYRAILPKATTGRADSTPHILMPMQYMFLRYIELHHPLTEEELKKGKQLRLFSLLPTKRGIECNHLKMCTNGLYGLLKRGGVKLPASGAEFRKVADDYWRDLFDIAKFETCNANSQER